jgi:hypothetical protein
MAIPQGRDAVRAVVAGVLVAADADQGPLEQADGRRKDELARERPAGEVPGNPPPDARQGSRETLRPGVLVVIAAGTELRVVAVLLAAAGVSTGRLEVAGRRGTDPDVGPGRWNRERPDPPQLARIANRVALGRTVGEASPVAFPPDPRLRVRDVPESLSGGVSSRGRRVDGQ